MPDSACPHGSYSTDRCGICIQDERDALRAENKRLWAALRGLRTAMDSNLRMTQREVKTALDVLLTSHKDG